MKKTMPYAAQLAEFAIKKFNTELPPEVLNVAVSALIDQYGLQIGGSEFSWSRGIHAYVLSQGTSDASSITRYGEKVSPSAAAFINGCFAHAQDFDDSHQEAQTHPGSVVIPAAMALGESLNCDGKTVLKAIALGMEIMLRLAHALCPACIEGGHHTPPTVGPFGAAIACGLLLGLSVEQLTQALGICGSYAGGLVAYTVGGGSVKRIHTGIAARNGLEAALLAKHGITGPKNIIEGAKGLFEVFGRGRAFPERLFSDLGERYLLTTLMFKPYNCCYLIHPAIELYLELVTKNQLAPEDIQSVRVGLSQFSVSHAGTITQPHDALGAQFSTAFTLALSHIDEAPGLHSYSDENLANARIRNLAGKIEVFCDEAINAQFPRENGCTIKIISTQDRIYEAKITAPKGSPSNLMTREDVTKKYFLNVADVLTLEEADLLLENLVNFQRVTVRELAKSAQKNSCLIQAKL